MSSVPPIRKAAVLVGLIGFATAGAAACAAAAVVTSTFAISTPRAISRRTKPTTRVLNLLVDRHLNDSASESWGYDVAAGTGLGTASVYPILRRLERAGWLLSRDEGSVDARTGGNRPPRTYFRINPEHWGAIRQELALRDARPRDAQSSAQGGTRSRAMGGAG